MPKLALFSLYDNTRALEFARELKKLGWDIIATRETVELLAGNGVPVRDIAEFTGITENLGFPPTLHPKIEAALTTEHPDRIDLVYDIPYPNNVGNDVGGRTLLALAAKGNRIPVMTPKDMETVIKFLKKDGKIDESFHKHLISKTNANIAAHYIELARLSKTNFHEGVIGELLYELMHGENPYQVPSCLYATGTDDPLAVTRFEQLNETPCFTNLADSDCILQTMCLAAEAFRLEYGKVPYIAMGAKHGNPCGMSSDWNDPTMTIGKALFGNPLAIWGGEFITNFPIDETVANLLVESDRRRERFGAAGWMLDVVMAPELTSKGLEILRRRKSRKIMRNSALGDPILGSRATVMREVRGGFILQPPPNYVLNAAEAVPTFESVGREILDTLIIAWSVAWSSNHGGNEIALAKDRQLLSAGGGSATVDAAHTAVDRANRIGHDVKGAVFAANAFFPFTDAPEVLVKAGCTSGLVPSGGMKESNVREYFDKCGVTMFYLPEQYRGFSRH